MYSALQQQCLTQLGISFYQLKANFVETEETSKVQSFLDWQQVPEQLITDLKVLFPNMLIVDNQLKLNDKVTWLLSDEKTITKTDDSLHTPLPHLMTEAEKKQTWQQLAKLCSENHG